MISNILSSIISIFKYHKKKIAVFLGLILLFLFTLFPYDDLSELISKKVTQASKNQIYLQFEELNIGFLPTPNVSFENVEVVAKNMPSLKASYLKVSPSLLDLLRFNYGARIYAEDFLNSEVSAGFRMGKPNKDNIVQHGFDLDVERLKLSKVNELIMLPVKVKGEVDLQAEGTFDPQFKEQPSVEFNFDSNKINIPTVSIPLKGFGSIILPNIDLSKTKIDGRLIAGELVINDALLGTDKDKIQIAVKGRIGLKLIKTMNSTRPQWSKYDIKARISVDASLKRQLYFLPLLDPYKTSSGKKLVYTLKATSPSFNAPPKLTKISKF